MTHEDVGNYAAKRHGAELNEMIAAEIKERIIENKISCADAHAAARKLKVDPADVGTAIDLLEVRISKCQLGLFGYGNSKPIPVLSDPIDPEMESTIKSKVVNNRITCYAAWDIASKFKVPRIAVSEVCEIMKIKISACQLGVFM